MFIYRQINALSPETCNTFIDKFESSDLKNPGILEKSDGSFSSISGKTSMDITFDPSFLKDKNWGSLLESLISTLEINKQNYVNRHALAFKSLPDTQIAPTFNMQRYLPGEGFSAYHCERASLNNNRLLVWMIYLNTVTNGGETEFYYQQHFETPIQGTLLIWPAEFTYLHRGIPSLTQSKYILTGWFEFIFPKSAK
jgi:hypothetical protein